MTRRANPTIDTTILEMVANARAAMETLDGATGDRLDSIVKAIAWSIYRPDRALELAKISVEDTGLGSVEDKVVKNQRKTIGTLNDLLQVAATGVISDEPDRGLSTWAKPVGVVGSITPSTNPGATPANHAMMALKAGNAIIISPSPTGLRTALTLQGFVREELDRVDESPDLFQVVQAPISFDKAISLAEQVDLVVATGDQQNVRSAYKSGTPCIGVGKGNVPVLIDESADLADAAMKIAKSKIFDNATSCSSENSVVVLQRQYSEFVEALTSAGGYHCSRSETKEIRQQLFEHGGISRRFLGKPIQTVVSELGFESVAADRTFLFADGIGIGREDPLSGEKLSLVLTIFEAADFEDGVSIIQQILSYEGAGHSVGIHTQSPDRARELAAKVPVGRVLVNQAHTFGNGGGFDNNLPFSMSMGCGTWAGNSISENLSYKHFFNTTQLVRAVDKEEPDAAVLFAGFV